MSNSNVNEAPANAPSPAKPKSKTLKALGWISGVTPTKMAAQEVASMASVSGWALKNFKGMLSFNRAQAKEDLKIASSDPERFWDELITTAKITEESVRVRYTLAYWFSYVLFMGLAIGIGMVAANYTIPMALIGNIMLLNVLLMVYITNLHKLYTAREQRVVTIPAFVKIMLQQPALLLPIPLPKNYKLREGRAPAKTEGDPA
ncbi:hypothetical protein [Pseudomonas aeruginosa]|uniref:hypothetical protein n=1 Tax=Pseudomonas aeruginosa TaxID=287 RepID=UPI003D289031